MAGTDRAKQRPSGASPESGDHAHRNGAGAAFRQSWAQGRLELIRADGSKVVAGCGFVVDYLRRHPEFSDLVL
jgi:predicted GNAT family acetyltransferase